MKLVSVVRIWKCSWWYEQCDLQNLWSHFFRFYSN